MTGPERIKALKELLAKDPNDIFSRYTLAMEYNGSGEAEGAIAELREVLKLDAKHIAAYQQLGQIYQKLNKTREAKRYLRKGIEVAIDANDIHARQEMEEMLEEIEDEW